MDDEPEPDDDFRLFREAMRGVRPLDTPKRRARSATAAPPAPARRRRSTVDADGAGAPGDTAGSPDARTDAATGAIPPGASGVSGPTLARVERGEVLEYRASGVQRNVLRALRRGQPAVEGSLDLHGLTALRATEILRDFLAEAMEARARCVRIVHGKGLGSGDRGPVLKTLVNTWLREQPAVLAFVSAPPEAGGTGATLVLLSRRTGTAAERPG